MRNLFSGLFLGAILSACMTASAERKGPKLTGESGRLKYAIIVEGQVECVDAWVSIPERTIECDSEPPDEPKMPRTLERIAKSNGLSQD
jgi:hypothetical protein